MPLTDTRMCSESTVYTMPKFVVDHSEAKSLSGSQWKTKKVLGIVERLEVKKHHSHAVCSVGNVETSIGHGS